MDVDRQILALLATVSPWQVLALAVIVTPLVGGLLAAAWLIGRGSEARGSATDWSGRVLRSLPAEVGDGLRADAGRRGVFVVAVLLLVGALILGLGRGPDGNFSAAAIRVATGGAVVVMLAALAGSLLKDRREGATIVDLGAHPIESGAADLSRGVRILLVVFALLNVGVSAAASRWGRAVLWGLFLGLMLPGYLPGRRGIRLTEGGVRLLGQITPWSGLSDPTWGEGRGVVALRRTGALARLWQSWLVVPVPEGRAEEVEAVLAGRLPSRPRGVSSMADER